MTNTRNTNNSGLRSFKGLATLFAFVVMCVICLLPQDAFATHVVGGDLRYRCLGNNLYEVRLTLRRDCFLGDPNAQFDDPASIGFFDAQTHQFLRFIGSNGQLFMPFRSDDTLNQEFISDCTISGMDVCVQQTTYVDTIFLPFLASGYELAYTRCCRNNSIQNIIEPIGTGMTLLTIISGEAQITCNSSPELPEYPPIYICVNNGIDFDFGIESDPDGDSIIYELFSPFIGGSVLNPMPQPPFPPPYDTVVWRNPPYSLDNLLGGVPLQIDRFTGHLTGMPNTPGQFLVGVRVFSYNTLGDLIEVTSREWQYNVRVCREVPEADFSVSTELNCDNLTLIFTDSSENAHDILWIFDYPNPDSETSTDPNTTYTYEEPGFYTAALIVTDEDSICFDTFMLDVGVFESKLSAEFEIDVVECGDSIVMEIVDLSIEPDLNFEVTSWQWILAIGTDTIDLDTLQNPTFVIDSSATDVSLTLRVFSENGCSAETTSTFDVNIIEIPFETIGVDSIGLCDGDTISLFPYPGNANFTYTWDPISGLDISDPHDPIAFPSQTTEYFVSVTDGLCEVTGEIVVVVQDTPVLSFVTETDCRSLEVEVTNTSQGGILFGWDFGDGSDPILAHDTTFTYDTPGNYLITLFSADGCDVITGEIITVAVILDSVDDTSISCFAEPVELNPDGDDALYDYEWAPSEGLSAVDIANPIADVDVTSTFYVTITDVENPLCNVVDSVNIIVPVDFDLAAPTDSAYCGSPEITISAGNSDLEYVWFDENGDTLSTSSTLVVRPIVQTSYFLMGVDQFGCIKMDTTTLFPTFFAYIVSHDVVICPGDDTVVAIINLDSTQILTYNWMPAEFIIGSNTVANPRVKPLSDQVFTVQIINSTLGCALEENITVFVTDFDYTLSNASTMCFGDSMMLNVTNNDTTTLTYVWTPAESIIDGADGPNPIVMPNENTSYFVQITNSDYGCVTEDSINVLVSEFDFTVSDDDQICLGDKLTLSITNNDTTSLDYLWSPAESIVGDPDVANPVVMPMQTTTYVVQVQNSEFGCYTVDSVTVAVSWFNPDFLEIITDPDTISTDSDEVFELWTNQSDDLQYQWSGPDIISDPTLPRIQAKPGVAGPYSYSVTVTNADGCVISAQTSNDLIVQDPACDMETIFIPNAFSPNGDGENDVLQVYGNYISDMELLIFNRWGEKVFHGKSQAEVWDGQFEGKALPAEVYGYYLRVMCPPDQEYITKGSIVLLR